MAKKIQISILGTPFLQHVRIKKGHKATSFIALWLRAKYSENDGTRSLYMSRHTFATLSPVHAVALYIIYIYILFLCVDKHLHLPNCNYNVWLIDSNAIEGKYRFLRGGLGNR